MTSESTERMDTGCGCHGSIECRYQALVLTCTLTQARRHRRRRRRRTDCPTQPVTGRRRWRLATSQSSLSSLPTRSQRGQRGGCHARKCSMFNVGASDLSSNLLFVYDHPPMSMIWLSSFPFSDRFLLRVCVELHWHGHGRGRESWTTAAHCTVTVTVTVAGKCRPARLTS